MEQSKIVTELKKTESPKQFLELEETRRAQNDFRFVCSKTYIYVSNNVDLLAISKNGKKLGDVLVVPLDVAKGVVSFPRSLVNAELAKMYISIICYKNGQPEDVLMLKSSMFLKSSPLKSAFGVFIPGVIRIGQSGDNYIVRIKNVKADRVQKHAFGLVIGSLT